MSNKNKEHKDNKFYLIGLGTIIGVVLGIFLDNIALGIAFGIIISSIFAIALD